MYNCTAVKSNLGNPNLHTLFGVP